MAQKMFITEMKQNLTKNDFIWLRTLYSPIIGIESITLYSLLFDFNYINRKAPSYNNINILGQITGLSINEIDLAKSKLEAVGLLRTFEKADNSHFLYILNPPLNPTSFRKNSTLWKNASKKIDEVIFEKVYFATNETQIKKDDFKETTVKYQDLFDMEITDNSTTLEMPVKFDNKESAIKGSTSSQFVRFLTNSRVSPSQLHLFQRILNSGLSSYSINLIIDYTFEINGKVVANHIETIANDLISKGITNPNDIMIEMKNARLNNKPSNNSKFDIESIDKKQKKTKKNNDSMQWNDIFDSLGGEL